MTCISPPELADRDLLAYADGEADPQVAEHLKLCAHCRDRAQRLARLQDQFTAQLYRFNCPSPTELGEYHLGTLSDEKAAALVEHLAECPRCAQEVAQLEGYLADLAPTLERGLLERGQEHIRVLVARLVKGGSWGGQPGSGGLVPAYAGLRGDQGEPIIYEADEVQVVIEVHDDKDQPGRKTMFGLVIGLDEPHQSQAHLWQADQRVASVPIEEPGNFLITHLAAGCYELILSGPDLAIHIEDLEI